MSDLQENLSLLNTLVPAAPEQVAAVVKEGADCIAAARRYVASVEEKRAQAGELLGRVRTALTALRDGATEDQGRLAQALAQAESALEAAVGALQDGEQDVRLAAQAAGETMGELQRSLADAGQRAKEAQDGVTSKASEASDALEEAQSDLDGAVSTAAGTAEDIEEAIGDGQEKVKEAADALNEKLEPVADTVGTMLADSGTRLGESMTALEAAVNGAVDDLGQRAEALVSALREALESEKEPLASAMNDVQDNLAELGQTAITPLEGWAGGREQAVEQLDALAGKQEALDKAVDNVKLAAQQAGIEWPA
jgi:uncharacterized phage infection (PIP) family protein YhgE